jgi:hypothetical protein
MRRLRANFSSFDLRDHWSFALRLISLLRSERESFDQWFFMAILCFDCGIEDIVAYVRGLLKDFILACLAHATNCVLFHGQFVLETCNRTFTHWTYFLLYVLENIREDFGDEVFVHVIFYSMRFVC